MDDLFLAEFHGFIDEKTWEIAKLSINYLQTLNFCVIKLTENNGTIENYSGLRDIIEVIRICILHGILIECSQDQYEHQLDKINKNQRLEYNSLFHFVKLFPELEDLGKVDDMCFLAFLLMNKVFTGFLESINNPISKWNERISMFYHHASILRYSEFLKEFIFNIENLENVLKIKNFHIPNNWLGYFAKLSLRWSNFGDDETELTIVKNKYKQNSEDSNFSDSKKKELFRKNICEQKPSLMYLLKKELENNSNVHDCLYSDKTFTSKSSIDSDKTHIIKINSINGFENEDSENDISIVYDENNIQDLEELLEHMWNPILNDSRLFIGTDSENQREENKKNILENENFEEYKTVKDLFNTYLENLKKEKELKNKATNSKNNFKFKKNVINLNRQIADVKEWYLYYYNLPLNKEEESIILNLQNNKCFSINCCNFLNTKNEKKLNFCCFTGYFYCDGCFGNNSCSVLPGLLAKYGNLTAVPVSTNSKNELEKLKNIPLININSLTAELWKSNRQLKQLVHLKTYLSSLWDNNELLEYKLKDVNIIDESQNLSFFEDNSVKCQYKESIKRRLIREYQIDNRFGKYDYFSIAELTEIAYEFFSQDVVMCSNETNLDCIVRELTEIAIRWKKHLSKCIHCQFEQNKKK